MDAVEIVYLVCFFLGVGFAVIAGLLSGVFSSGGEAAGNIDVSGGDIDAGGQPVGHGESVHLSPVSPVTIAMFIAAFGGSGVIYDKYFHLPVIVHVPLAGATGFAIAVAVFYFFYRVMAVSEASSSPKQGEAVGVEAEVLTSIPADGVGEIAYTLRESRYNNPARSVDGKPIPAHTVVKVLKIVGSTYYVEKAK